MDKYTSYIIIKGKQEIETAGNLNDVSLMGGHIHFKYDIHELEEEFRLTIGRVVGLFYKDLLDKSNKDILRESFAEKNLRIKPYTYEYSTTFNFYECIDKYKDLFGFVAKKGDVVAELVINIEFD